MRTHVADHRLDMSPLPPIVVAALALLLPSPARAAGHADALAELAGPEGPQRFAVVRDGLFRGGQPALVNHYHAGIGPFNRLYHGYRLD